VDTPQRQWRAKFSVVSLFPEMIQAFTRYGVVGRAFDNRVAELGVVNPRQFSRDKHGNVDDRPYGGGPGMVACVEPWRDALRQAKASLYDEAAPAPRCIYLSPQGKLLTQAALQDYSAQLLQGQGLVLLCGRYEGLDERLIATEVDEELSIGDYVISGGELAALALIDGIVRLLPGVLGDQDSAANDSFSEGLLDSPHYTRPEVIDDMAVPSVLLSGDHAAIARWRLQQSLGQTWLKRPDLLRHKTLNADEQKLLREFQQQYRDAHGNQPPSPE